MSKESVEKKRDEILKQFECLSCDSYRITLKPRVAGLWARNYGNIGEKPRKAKGISERFWTQDEVIELIPQLEIENLKGYDIYFSPISDTIHHLVVDDVTSANLSGLTDDGYLPALVQRTSPDNFQAILICYKHDRRDEQTLANKIVVELNRKFGDKKFSGAIHPFRLGGFANKKPGKEDPFTNVVDVCGRVCEKTDSILNSLRLSTAESNVHHSQQVEPALSVINSYEVDSDALTIFTQKWSALERETRERALPLDYSRIDFRTCSRMRAMGYTNSVIGYCLLNGSPGLAQRHPDPSCYIQRTLTNC